MFKNVFFSDRIKWIFAFFSLLLTITSNAQNQTPKSDFWDHVRFGGGFGISVGSGYTDILIAPSAVYNFNDYFSAGVGLQGSHVKFKNEYTSNIYGGSLIGLFNPMEAIQLSVELEQVRVNQEFKQLEYKRNFWNTALYFGAGYSTDNITVGFRYNVLFKKDDFVYSEAFMPFVRVYF
ncbi:hypothetical protein KIH23_11140 [Flavobacterium sp. CYK-55]|uniref:hypothetical protein n=1 Tax=Flavobacterium sp. CYK-55 TaxID=2835529 RepID=UPI001BCC975C|nr:hypothetical protein [Flavobacterium sp. CYK-55]MBS7787851.1 hypothetical protein [Flavobacterium sp. CYK-55]